MSSSIPDKAYELPKVKKVLWSQWLAGSIVTLLVIVTGLMNGWTSPYLAQLTSPETEVALKLTNSEASWVASYFNLGRIVGAFIGAIILSYIGRQKTLLISSLPLAFGWIFIIVATSVPWLYAGRISSGISTGMIWSVIPMYIGEIADPAIRGALVSLTACGIAVGIVLGNLMGSYLSMQQFAYISLVPNILFIVLFSLVPESPYYHVLNSDIAKAEKSLKWYRRETNVKKELQELQDFVSGSKLSILDLLKEYRHSYNWKGIVVVLCISFFFHLCGHNTIVFYAEIIMTKSEISLAPNNVVIGMGCLAIVAGNAAILLVDRCGRRLLLIVSSLGVSISHGLLGLHFHLLSLDLDPRDLTWLPILALVMFNIFLYCGLFSIPSSLISEIFPPSIKTSATFITTVTSALFAFFFTKSFQPYLDLVGEKYVYWSYAIGVFLAVPFTYFFIPETKGKSLMEIQAFLGNRNKNLA